MSVGLSCGWRLNARGVEAAAWHRFDRVRDDPSPAVHSWMVAEREAPKSRSSGRTRKAISRSGGRRGQSRLSIVTDEAHELGLRSRPEFDPAGPDGRMLKGDARIGRGHGEKLVQAR